MSKKAAKNTLRTDITLTRKQLRMYNQLNEGRWKEVLFYGSSRSGKTFLIIYWMIIQALAFAANSLVLRYLFTSLQNGMLQQTLPAVLNAIAELNGYSSYDKITMSDGKRFCQFNGKTNVLMFYNGAYILFSSLRGSSSSESTYDKILSTEWGHIFVDEVSEIEERSIDVLRSRLSQKLKVRNKILFALNPTTKSGWTYRRFFKNETREGTKIDKATVAAFLVMKFKLDDNKENVAQDYEDTLRSMSTLQRKRFLEGEYFDESEGEIFKKINWATAQEWPRQDEWEAIVIYTDPSAGENKNNDFKASVLLGRAKGKIWLIDVRAVQGTTMQMTENIYELYHLSPIPAITKIWIEKKQLPQDFIMTYERYWEERGEVGSISFDTRSMGDKFTAIESTLEPMFTSGKFVFNSELKESAAGQEAVTQFLMFSRKTNRDRKDDIPDACMRGVIRLELGKYNTSKFLYMPEIVKKPLRTFF